MEIKRPQKAPINTITNEQLEKLVYPVAGSPKLDGFRCLITDRACTSTMKSFTNRFVQQELSHSIYAGLDGEIVVGKPNDPDAFHNTSGPIRRFEGEPDFKLYAFDNVCDKTKPYYDRWLSNTPSSSKRVIILEQRILKSSDDVLTYEAEMLKAGYEGAIIRSLTSLYKEGRCTFNEMNIFKRKPFVDIEASIMGVEEAMENCNEKTVNELGLSKRSQNRENKVPKGTLGSFILWSPLWVRPFHAACGEGFTDTIKQKIWDNRQEYLGKTVTVKYQKYGSRKAPRMPKVIKLQWDI